MWLLHFFIYLLSRSIPFELTSFFGGLWLRMLISWWCQANLSLPWFMGMRLSMHLGNQVKRSKWVILQGCRGLIPTFSSRSLFFFSVSNLFIMTSENLNNSIRHMFHCSSSAGQFPHFSHPIVLFISYSPILPCSHSAPSFVLSAA